MAPIAGRMRLSVLVLAAWVAACGPASPPPDGNIADDAAVPPAADPAAVRPSPEAAADVAVEAPAPPALVVDHVWVRDADDPAEQAARRAAIERLRLAVERGGSFEAAWQALGVAPEAWHVGESESYPVALIPAAARALPPGSVSVVIPGDGGLHLFRILRRDGAR